MSSFSACITRCGSLQSSSVFFKDTFVVFLNQQLRETWLCRLVRANDGSPFMSKSTDFELPKAVAVMDRALGLGYLSLELFLPYQTVGPLSIYSSLCLIRAICCCNYDQINSPLIHVY